LLGQKRNKIIDKFNNLKNIKKKLKFGDKINFFTTKEQIFRKKVNIMLASIINNKYLKYPNHKYYYSPSEFYPEYIFDDISLENNHVYSAVRNLFFQLGLDIENFGTTSWNPLGKYIKPGDNVFVLCNFVFHKKGSEDETAFYAKCTHPSVIRAIIDYVLLANKNKGKILVGNAPVQSCDFKKIIKDAHLDLIKEFYKSKGIYIEIKDLRTFSIKEKWCGFTYSYNNVNEININLCEKSFLNDLYSITGKNKIKFRISDYNPEKTENYHKVNFHNYSIAQDIIESDVIINVPKLKTHEKVGITAALKGYVGIVANKDCLAHYRLGHDKLGGDEYPDGHILQLISSLFHDFVQRRRYAKIFSPFLFFVDQNYRRILRKGLKKILEGSWYGNDTAWRMALDVAFIAHYCNKQGEICNSVQKRNLALIDGIIAGEHNGPLKPLPVPAKCLIFSDNVVLADLIACKIMGWEEEKIPLIKYAMGNKNLFFGNINIFSEGKRIKLSELKPVMGRMFRPPDGWINHIFT
jgi:uncharacterized protein (DUF362 family)